MTTGIRPVTNRQEIPAQMRMEANLRAGTTGVSSVGSSITSASSSTAPAASSGFCATISGWISSVIEGIRNCLSKLPLIGCCFSSATTSTTTPASSTTVDPQVAADAVLVDVIKSVYRRIPAGTSGSSAATISIPGTDLRDHAIDQFNAIQTDAAKWEAFGVVLNADNADTEVGKFFYDALSPDQQEEFRGEMYAVNGNSQFSGYDHREGFGDYMAHHQIRHNIARTAVANLQAAAL